MQMAALTREPKVDYAFIRIRYNERRAHSKYLFFENEEAVWTPSGSSRRQVHAKWRSDQACRAPRDVPVKSADFAFLRPTPHDVLSLLSFMHPLSPTAEQAD